MNHRISFIFTFQNRLLSTFLEPLLTISFCPYLQALLLEPMKTLVHIYQLLHYELAFLQTIHSFPANHGWYPCGLLLVSHMPTLAY